MRYISYIIFSFIIITSLSSVNAQPPSNLPASSYPGTNGDVEVLEMDSNGIVYLGGNFTYIGEAIGYGMVFNDTSSNNPITPYLGISNGTTNAISDGNGGFYVTGAFEEIGGQSIARLAHINPDGTVNSTFSITSTYVSGTPQISALALDGTILYIGGSFSTINGQSRTNIAAIDTTTGNLTSFTVTPNGGIVNALITDNQYLYIGGQFNTINGTARNGLARVDFSGNLDTTWNPNPLFFEPSFPARITNFIIDTTNEILYPIGLYNSINAQSRSNISQIDISTGSSGNATSWTVTADGRVRDGVLIGSSVFISGGFTTINGELRNGIAELSITDATVSTTNFGLSTTNDDYYATVDSLTHSGSIIYAAGMFTDTGNGPRQSVFAYDTSTDSFLNWAPQTAPATVIAESNGNIFVGGNANAINGEYRFGAAAFNSTTGEIAAWNPDLDSFSSVQAIAVDETNNRILLGGDIYSIESTTVNNLVAVNDTTGTFDPAWLPEPDYTVYDLIISGSDIYVGGGFSTIDGQSRSGIARLNSDGSLDTGFTADVSGGLSTVETLVLNGSQLYLGGSFSTIQSQTRQNLALVSAIDGTLDGGFVANTDSTVTDMLLDNSRLYVVGSFTSINSTTRNRVAAVAADTGSLQSFDPNANDTARSLAVYDSNLYIGGAFTTISGASAQGLVAYDLPGLTLTSWRPDIQYSSRTLLVEGNYLFSGGVINRAGGQYSGYLATYLLANITPTPTPSPTNSPTPTTTTTPAPSASPTVTGLLTPSPTITTTSSSRSTRKQSGPVPTPVVPAEFSHLFVTNIGGQDVFFGTQNPDPLIFNKTIDTSDRFMSIRGIAHAGTTVVISYDPGGTEQEVLVGPDSSFFWQSSTPVEWGTYKIFLKVRGNGHERRMNDITVDVVSTVSSTQSSLKRQDSTTTVSTSDTDQQVGSNDGMNDTKPTSVPRPTNVTKQNTPSPVPTSVPEKGKRCFLWIFCF